MNPLALLLSYAKPWLFLAAFMLLLLLFKQRGER